MERKNHQARSWGINNLTIDNWSNSVKSIPILLIIALVFASKTITFVRKAECWKRAKKYVRHAFFCLIGKPSKPTARRYAASWRWSIDSLASRGCPKHVYKLDWNQLCIWIRCFDCTLPHPGHAVSCWQFGMVALNQSHMLLQKYVVSAWSSYCKNQQRCAIVIHYKYYNQQYQQESCDHCRIGSSSKMGKYQQFNQVYQIGRNYVCWSGIRVSNLSRWIARQRYRLDVTCTNLCYGEKWILAISVRLCQVL